MGYAHMCTHPTSMGRREDDLNAYFAHVCDRLMHKSGVIIIIEVLYQLNPGEDEAMVILGGTRTQNLYSGHTYSRRLTHCAFKSSNHCNQVKRACENTHE